MNYLNIITVNKALFSINLNHQIYIRISSDGTEVCFFSMSYRLVFTTNENSIRGEIISKNMMHNILTAMGG